MKKVVVLLVFLLPIINLKASTITLPDLADSLISDSIPLKNIIKVKDTVTSESLTWQLFDVSIRPDSVNSVISPEITDEETNKKILRRKKIIASILAFPVPCGIFGAHRIYLGTKPYIPLVYIATLGGAAGIVPFIDFVVLCLEKDVSKYCNNPNVIMWAK